MLITSSTHLFFFLFFLLPFTEVRLQKDEAVEGAWRLWFDQEAKVSVLCVCSVTDQN